MRSGGDDHVDLLGLMSGEMAPVLRRGVADHVRGCPACLDRLLDATVLVGELRDSSRYAPVDPSEVPPFDLSRRHAVTARPTVEPVDPSPAAPGRGLRRVGLALAGAAAVVSALLGGITIGESRTDAPPTAAAPPTPAAPADVPLLAVGVLPNRAAGAAAMIGSGADRRMRLTLTGLAAAAPQDHYEVWLLDTRTGRTLSVGPLAGQSGEYDLPDGVTDGYNAIDVSVQAPEDGVRHSGNSVLRGALA